MIEPPERKGMGEGAASAKPSITLEYLQRIIPDIIAQHGYVSANLIDRERGGTAGRMLSMFSAQLGITRDPATNRGDTHYLAKREATPNGRKKLEYDGKPLGQLIVEYMDRRGRLTAAEFGAEYGFEGRIPIVAMAIETAYRNRGEKLGWEKTTEEGKPVYRRSMLTNELIDRYLTRLLEVTNAQDRFLAADIDPDHPELVERLMRSQVVGNGTFMEKEGLAVMRIEGKDVFYFARESPDTRPTLTSYNINPDGNILSKGEPPDPDYMDRIARG